MNGNGFGFNRYPQRPSVRPQEVGNALSALGTMKAQQAQAAMPAQMPAAPMRAAPAAPVAPAQAPTDEQNPTAIKLAVAEALSRRASGGASRGQQGLPGNPFNTVQLARMGLSQAEISLLHMSGGVR